MADPREDVNFDGIGYEAETFLHDNTIVYDPLVEGGSEQVGLAVTTEADRQVTLVGDGERVTGRLNKVEPGGVCVVQTGGHMRLPGGDGATLTIGEKIVGDLGAAAAEGYIRAVATATAAELGHARGEILDNDDTESVLVRLETAT